MLHPSFVRDVAKARETEIDISNRLKSHYGIETLWMCPNNRYDLKVRNRKGEIHWIEIKEDFSCEKTGNVGLEYSCRGKDSGIRVTKADYYIYKLHLDKNLIDYRLISVIDLRKMIEQKLYFRIVNGGDAGSDSINYLFKLGVFYKWSIPLFQ